MADVPEPDYLCDVAPEKELRLPDASASAVPPEPLEAPSNAGLATQRSSCGEEEEKEACIRAICLHVCARTDHRLDYRGTTRVGFECLETLARRATDATKLVRGGEDRRGRWHPLRNSSQRAGLLRPPCLHRAEQT